MVQKILVLLHYKNKGINILNNSKMEQSIYFVAVGFSSETIMPTIVEQFYNEADANTYAALMCRTKHHKYVMLKQETEWDGTPQEN